VSTSSQTVDPAETPEIAERRNLERTLRAQLATVTGGLAPDVYVNAWWDWLLNLAKEPPAQLQIMEDAMAKAADNFAFAMQASVAGALPPAAGDDRFSGDPLQRFRCDQSLQDRNSDPFHHGRRGASRLGVQLLHYRCRDQ